MRDVLLSYSLLKKASPIGQSFFVLIVGVLLIAGLGMVSQNEEIEWFIACASLGLFSWMNPILGIFTKQSWRRYFGLAIVSFALLALALFQFAGYVSTVSLGALDEYKKMLQITTIFFFCAHGVALLIKKMTEFVGLKL